MSGKLLGGSVIDGQCCPCDKPKHEPKLADRIYNLAIRAAYFSVQRTVLINLALILQTIVTAEMLTTGRVGDHYDITRDLL